MTRSYPHHLPDGRCHDACSPVRSRPELPGDSRTDERCVRCGSPLFGEIAEVADGIVHQPCMREGEDIA